MKKSSLLILLLAILTALPLSAQSDRDKWYPVASWPFVYKDFQRARIVTTAGKAVHGDANIHVGMHYLWFVNGQKKKMAAVAGTISQVKFNNGDLYVPVDNKLCKVILEDTINGKPCRIYRSDEVNMVRFNEQSHNNMGTINFGIAGLDNLSIKVAENGAFENSDEEPLPMNAVFYMLYNGDTFQVTESNVLKHIEKARRSEFRGFTRSAEIIYSNESSILKIWNTFMKK